METRETIAETSPEALSPRGPWGFLAPAARMGLDGWTLQFMAAWLCFHVLTSTFWALHLKALAGSSALPAYWGELLTLRDVWEMAENGGLKNHPLGLLAPLGAGAAFLWSLWAGWKLQARAAGLKASFGAWCGGFLDALLVGALPIGLLAWIVLGLLSRMASTGIQGLGWLDLAGGTVARLAFVSTFFLQAWLCRLGRAGRPGTAYGDHLGRSFLRLWTHAIQWPVLVVAGAALRAGLPFLVLVLGWRLGGGTPARVAWLLVLQALAVAASAWLMAWFLRVTALFWRHDAQVRDAIQDLESRARS
ncbi:MAG TPA: hypothetical protein VK188_11380 [Holophaga sp.]|nr:hypothetical protein [Holophaga sp.]